ncbi:UNVERIFIED_CONTAM: Abscisic acid receptor PYL4 [Sesamum radiatum]|uniref:Abscisic acid receptor PYL4 n=1 Tax=Sesamum radiatum TaxID=300843 RepID=A0AAW2TF91_SESRA
MMRSSLQLHRINPLNHTGCAAVSLHHKHSKPTWVCPVSEEVPENVLHHHTHAVSPTQCCSAVVRAIEAPADTVWSVVRRFDMPQAYKHFLKSCHVIVGDGDVGTLREVRVVSGLPAESSTERLEILDDERHVMSFSVVGAITACTTTARSPPSMQRHRCRAVAAGRWWWSRMWWIYRRGIRGMKPARLWIRS